MSNTLSPTDDRSGAQTRAGRAAVWRSGIFGVLLTLCGLGCDGSVGAPSGPGRGHDARQTPGAPGVEVSAIGPDGAVLDPAAPAQPVPTFMRRLTNAEYVQSLTDLVGEPAGLDRRVGLPEDPRSHGFDNNAEVETISAVHADRYSAAAEALASAVMTTPDRRAKVMGCDPGTDKTCLRTYIQRFGRRVYRRPLTDEEVTGYLDLAGSIKEGAPNAGPAAVLQAMLLSPHFLFKIEIGQPDAQKPGAVRLNAYEMATRLSYTLWTTTPDDALLDSAERGELDSQEGVANLARQMMEDPRAKRAIAHFYTQWLQLDDLDDLTIDAARFPMWSDSLRRAMAEETSRFVESIIWSEGTSFLDVLGARYTFVNGELAALYGLPAGDASWHRVDFDDSSPRIGLLTQPSLLTLTSHSDRISPTKRGLYVRSVLLCTQVPSPPPGVLAVVPPATLGESERDQFARHTTDPSCAACHTLMDPIGWGLSQFDSIGAFRTVDSNNQPFSVDGAINGFDPPEFSGPRELAERIRESEEFANCVSSSLYRYAYGRGTINEATSIIGENERAFRASGFDFKKALLAVVTSDAFRNRVSPELPGAGVKP